MKQKNLGVFLVDDLHTLGRLVCVKNVLKKLLQEKIMEDDVSLCLHCQCMTKTINNKCGKCKGDKIE